MDSRAAQPNKPLAIGPRALPHLAPGQCVGARHRGGHPYPHPQCDGLGWANGLARSQPTPQRVSVRPESPPACRDIPCGCPCRAAPPVHAAPVAAAAWPAPATAPQPPAALRGSRPLGRRRASGLRRCRRRSCGDVRCAAG
eukprot:364605-Chlamydomonas_euryale.AAC.12